MTQYQNELNVESEEITLEEMYLEGITLAGKNDMYEIQCESEDFNRICLQTKDMQWTEGNEYIVSFKIYSPTENSIFIQWNEGDVWKQKIISVTEGMNNVNFTIDYKKIQILYACIFRKELIRLEICIMKAVVKMRLMRYINRA